jgi:hypothetical protein
MPTHHAAAVFDEAARLSYQLGQLWPQASALTPKGPAHAALSHAAAQPHRPPNQPMQFIEDKMHSVIILRTIHRPSEAPPVPCPKEPV